MGMPELKMTHAAINGARWDEAHQKPKTYLITSGSRKTDTLRGFMLVVNAASASFVIQRKVKG